MAIDYAILHRAEADTSIPKAAPTVPHVGGQKALAAATNSNPINGPCEILCVPDADCYIAFGLQTAGNPDAANSPLKLLANQPRFFWLPKGTWLLRTT